MSLIARPAWWLSQPIFPHSITNLSPGVVSQCCIDLSGTGRVRTCKPLQVLAGLACGLIASLSRAKLHQMPTILLRGKQIILEHFQNFMYCTICICIFALIAFCISYLPLLATYCFLHCLLNCLHGHIIHILNIIISHSVPPVRADWGPPKPGQ